MNPCQETKRVQTREYLNILEKLIRDHKTLRVPVSGNSMAPFLVTERDCVLVQEPQQSLRKGDIVLFKRNTGEYILHRICKIKNDEFYTIGDAQTKMEGPIQRKQIFGIVIKVQRKGIWIDERNRWWRFFQYVWICIIPLRSFFRKMYGIMSV